MPPKKKIETGNEIATSRSSELRNIVNAHLGDSSDQAQMADHEMYKSGYWSTGILPIDVLLGGGVAKGRMALASGESQTLKSLIGLSTVAQVQRQGGTAAYIDTEKGFQQGWAEQLGINMSELILIQPKVAEVALDQMEVLVHNDVDYVCFDSIATMLPNSERELQLSGKANNQPARIAALMALSLRKLNAANSKTAILWVTQMRDNIGAMPMQAKTIKTGGKSIEYYVSQSFALKKVGSVKMDVRYFDGEKKDVIAKKQVGQKFRAELLKARNKSPFDIQHLIFDYASGKVDQATYLMAQGLELGLVDTSGSWWTYTDVDTETGEVIGEHKANSKDNFHDLLETTPEAYNSIMDKVCAKYGLDKESYAYYAPKELV